MVLYFKNGNLFTEAWTKYQYRPALNSDKTNRIIVPIKIEDITTSAFIDTASPYVVCSPEVAQVINIDPSEAIEKINYNIRGNKVPGGLYRLSITLIAEKGDSLSLNPTVFVPHDVDQEAWDSYPTVLGLITFLELLRFAIDFSEQKFYFAVT